MTEVAENGRLGVCLDIASVAPDDLDLSTLREAWPDWRFYPETEPHRVGERIAQAGMVISNKVVLSKQVLEQATYLKLVCIAATGTNNVDLAAARELGIAVTNVTGYATPSVVQHVFSMILSLTTRLEEYKHRLAAGAWQKSPHFCLLDFPIRELAGKNLGIVGCGVLGRSVAEMGRCFGMKILLAQRAGGTPQLGRIPLHELLPQVDVLSLHCPLVPATQGLIGSKELALMRSDALLINTARGGIIDEAALARALRQGQIGGAGIDVLQQEPPLDQSPLLEPSIPRLILTPHIAWASRESRQRLIVEISRNIKAFTQGKGRNRVA